MDIPSTIAISSYYNMRTPERTAVCQYGIIAEQQNDRTAEWNGPLGFHTVRTGESVYFMMAYGSYAICRDGPEKKWQPH